MSAVTTTTPDSAWRELHEAATAPYKQAGSFAWHFARGKLGRDPVFRGLIERGLVTSRHRRVVDIGCGQGLFASLLASMSAMQSAGRWPASWRSTPVAADYTGIELMPKDIARAEASIGHLRPAPRMICGNMCSADLPACDLVVILDVLHYVDIGAQDAVLRRVRDALQPDGRLLLRIGDASSRRGFAISQWVDRTVTRVRGHKVSPTWGRPLSAWIAVLESLGFKVQSIPMSEGTPFANVLLVADLGAGCMTPQTLDRAGIARRIPHSGSMCLLERLERWGADAVHCSTTTHRHADNPLRTAGGLLAPCAIEYAAQAMALHGGLLAAEGSTPSAGFLASARNVRMHVARLDDIDGALQVHARRLSGDATQVLYEFAVQDAQGHALADGRAVVVLNTPLAMEGFTA